MSLRRTALQRRTELARVPMRRRAREAQARTERVRRQRDTGPTKATRELVADRAGFCCEVCGALLRTLELGWVAVGSVHHRRPRAMGGTTRVETNSPANLLLVCGTGTTGCHQLIEANRTRALAAGHLVRQTDDPAAIPTLLHRGWVTLTHDGTYQEAA